MALAIYHSCVEGLVMLGVSWSDQHGKIFDAMIYDRSSADLGSASGY